MMIKHDIKVGANGFYCPLVCLTSVGPRLLVPTVSFVLAVVTTTVIALTTV